MSKPPGDDPKQKDPKQASVASEFDSVAEFYRAAPQPAEPTVVVADDPPPGERGEAEPAPVEPARALVATDDLDEPLVPASSDADALRDAVGVAPTRARDQAKAERDADDETPPVKRNRKLFTVAALSMLAVLVVTTFVLLGRVNSTRFAITCATDHISAEQGRTFPPWGTRPLRGAEWKAIPLPPNAECKTRETETQAELEEWYLTMLVERASATLTTPNLLDAIASPVPGAKPGPSMLDTVSAQLDQALLLSRSPDRRDQRKEVERLQGDVQYWRASLRLRDASAALIDASRQFDAAAQQRPRHVTDAAAWGAFVKKLSDDLKAGPNGVPPAAAGMPPSPAASAAPLGSALPVETPPPAAGSDAPPPAMPDAGLPTGGVLL